MATASAAPIAIQLRSILLSSTTNSPCHSQGHFGNSPQRPSLPEDNFPHSHSCQCREGLLRFSVGRYDMPTTFQVVQPINGDPFIGSLKTPVTSSPLIAWYLSNLPANRTAVSPLLCGIEMGLAHGFLLVGPFVKTGPLCNTEYTGAAGSLAAGGLVVILSIVLTMYGVA